MEFEQFLNQLVTNHPDEPLLLVMDNASYHKSAPIRHWFAAHTDHVSVLFLPPYSPQLNLIERVWRFVKHRIACHHFWNDLEGLVAHTQSIIDYVIATFHTDPKPGIRLCHNLRRST